MRLHTSLLAHAITVSPNLGGSRTIAPGDVVDFDEVLGQSLEGADVTVEAAIGDELRASFGPVEIHRSRKSTRAAADVPADDSKE